MRHAFALRRRPTQRRDDASRQAAVWLGDRAEHILTRLSELLAEREKVHGQATAAAIERVALPTQPGCVAVEAAPRGFPDPRAAADDGPSAPEKKFEAG